MKSFTVYNLKGEDVGKKELNPLIFNIKANEDLIKQVVDVQMSNARIVYAHTKGRSDVSGGGKKPWKQKGTGRARHGSIRSPLWKGGGVTFGPDKSRNYSKSINKKMKKKALFMVLSDKANTEGLKLVDNFELKEIKTKTIAESLNKITGVLKNILIVVDKKNDNIVKSVKNIPRVSVIMADSLNVVDLLKYENILFSLNSLDVLEKVYLN